MESYKTTKDLEFVAENQDSFEVAETLAETISTKVAGKYCYVFLMIEAGGKGGAPLHVASNMDATNLAGVLADTYNKVVADLTPGGEGNA